MKLLVAIILVVLIATSLHFSSPATETQAQGGYGYAYGAYQAVK